MCTIQCVKKVLRTGGELNWGSVDIGLTESILLQYLLPPRCVSVLLPLTAMLPALNAQVYLPRYQHIHLSIEAKVPSLALGADAFRTKY